MPAPAICLLSCPSPTHGPFQGWLILCKIGQLLNPVWVQAQRSVLASGMGTVDRCCGVGGGERNRQCSLGEQAGGIKQGYWGCLSRLVLFILNGSRKTLPECAKCTFVDAVDKICLFITSFLFSAILVLYSRLLLADFWGGLTHNS